MDLVEGERVLWQGRPSWRAQTGYFLRWGGLAIVPGVLATVIDGYGGATGLALWQWLLVSLALLIVVAAVDAVRRASVFYMVTDQRIRIRRGILSRREETARFDRVQNVNSSQSLLDRLLGVGDVDFDTAGTSEDSDDFRFAGVAEPKRLVRIVAEGTQALHPGTRSGL